MTHEIKTKDYVFFVDKDDYLKFKDRKFSALKTKTKIYARTFNKHSTGILLHRLVMGLSVGDVGIVDHINGNTFDNRKDNLRLTNRAGNMMNSKSILGKNPHRGVCWNKLKSKWFVHISYRDNGKRIRLCGGYFPKEKLNEAIKKRKALELEYFKEFAPR